MRGRALVSREVARATLVRLALGGRDTRLGGYVNVIGPIGLSSSLTYVQDDLCRKCQEFHSSEMIVVVVVDV